MPIYKVIAQEIKTWSHEIIAESQDEASSQAFDIDINDWELVDVGINEVSVTDISSGNQNIITRPKPFLP